MPQLVCPKCGAQMGRESALIIVGQTKLGAVSRRIACFLAEHFDEWMPRARIASAIYAGEDGGPICADTTITNLIRFYIRPRLAEKNITIESGRRAGIRMRWTEQP